jgi:Flp pilus assembly protein TadD
VARERHTAAEAQVTGARRGAQDPAGATGVGGGDRRTLFCAAAVLTGVALVAVFGSACFTGFIGYDDADYVFRNPHLREGSTLDRVRWAFTAFHAANWHPLTWLSFMADEALLGLDPGWLHAENIVLHGVNTLLLLWLLVRSTGRVGRSALVAALFALHPLRVESVVWITERKGLLMALWSLAALHAHLSAARRPSRSRRLLVAACFTLAVLAKPQAVVLPVVLLLFDGWPLGRFGAGAPRGSRLAAVAAQLPLLLPAAVVTLLTVAAQRQAGALTPLYALPLGARAAAAVVAPAGYLAKTLLPHGLAVAYPFVRPPGWQVAGAILLLAGLTAAALRERRRRPWLLAGWLGFLAFLAPVSNLFQVGGQAMADRYTYLPHVPLFVAAVWSGAGVFRDRRALRPWVGAATALLVATLALAARVQTAVWRDDLSLFSHAVAVAEGSWKMHFNLGNTLRRLGRDDEAERQYRLAIAAWPAYPEARNNLGTLLAGRGGAAEAEDLFLSVVTLDPGHVSAWMNLGRLYDEHGDPAGSVAAYRQAVSLLPGAAEPRVRLGRALLRLGERDEALSWCRDALRLEPASEAAAACSREASAIPGPPAVGDRP